MQKQRKYLNKQKTNDFYLPTEEVKKILKNQKNGEVKNGWSYPN